jgi:hypothetical protein
MASVIIGNSIGATITSKVLQRQNFNKEPNGLETIIEAYAIATANRDTIVPERFTLHSVFSSSSKKYSRMAVDSVATEEQDGGITQMLVTYVGLTSSTGLPPPIIRLIPTAGEGIYGPPLVIEAEYMTDVSETEFASGQLARNSGSLRAILFNPVIKMPAIINGTVMPQDPIPPFRRNPGAFGSGAIINYAGYCVLSVSCERRGLFLVARNTYHEVRQISQVIQGSFS